MTTDELVDSIMELFDHGFNQPEIKALESWVQAHFGQPDAKLPTIEEQPLTDILDSSLLTDEEIRAAKNGNNSNEALPFHI